MNPAHKTEMQVAGEENLGQFIMDRPVSLSVDIIQQTIDLSNCFRDDSPSLDHYSVYWAKDWSGMIVLLVEKLLRFLLEFPRHLNLF
jgi:hypothetical protein